jgi:hypothetical protein
MAANESSAAGSLRTISTSNVTYSTTYNAGFAGELSHLGPSTAGATSDAADLIDGTLAGTVGTPAAGDAVKSGYVFTYVAGAGTAGDPTDPINTYTTESTPLTTNVTGVSFFCVDQTNVVRKDPAGTQPADTAGTQCDDGTGTFPAM